MAARYALIDYTAPDGESYAQGDKIDVEVSSDEQKATDERLVATGIYSVTKPAGTGSRSAARGEQETS